jgi:hypothetical protein
VFDQLVTDRFAIYHADCMDVMQSMPDGSVHLSIYSPPFGGLYHYSSSERDLSNSDDYVGFLEHYEFVVQELARITMPGRMSAVHCMDVPLSNSGTDCYRDFPGDIIRMHERHGWAYAGRHAIWKEPLAVRLRTMQKNLAHASLVADSIDCGVAAADYVLMFRRAGANPVPVAHPVGLLDYAGDRTPPAELLPYRGWSGKQTENRFSHVGRHPDRPRAAVPRGARQRGREARAPAAVGRHRPRCRAAQQPRRDGVHAVHGRRLRGIQPCAARPPWHWCRAEGKLLPAGLEERATRRGGPA